jgi:alcohol dehydrogenase (cytochrome c)
MRSIGWLAILGLVLLVALSPVMLGAPARLSAQSPVSYTDVTDGRLLNPEPQNWLMYRGNYSGWGYSPLDRITPANVKKLVPVWSFSTGVTEGHQSPPIVNNGVMFVTTPQQQVIALNAKTGDVIWRYKRDLPEDLLQLHPTNRGVGLYEDKVYIGTVDAHVIALDAKTGKVVWARRSGTTKGYLLHAGPARRPGQGHGRDLASWYPRHLSPHSTLHG